MISTQTTPLRCLIGLRSKLVDQNSALKKEAGIAERKLLARNERIQNLEALLQDADRRLAIQNQKFEAQLQQVKERLDQARGTPACHVARVSADSGASPKGRCFFSAQLRAHREASPWGRRGCVEQRLCYQPLAWRHRQPADESSERREVGFILSCERYEIRH